VDFRDSPAESSFRRRVRTWLQANVPSDPGRREHGEFENLEHRFEELRQWQRRLAGAGFVGITWPPEHGGLGASLMEQAILNEELTRARAPELLNLIGVGLVGPTLIAWGTEAQRQRYLAPILTAEEIWCQGFSEPGAGSDLANLRTVARQVDSGFLITGQKVWTSLAQYADFCLLLARSNREVPRHHGISALIVDMRAPGVTIGPLRQMTGDAEFNEVFFEDVRVPAENLIGRLDQGWRVAITTLMHERATIAVLRQARLEITLHKLMALARSRTRSGRRAAADPVIRHRLAQLCIENQVLKCNTYRALAGAADRGDPGPMSSAGKLHWSELDQRLMELAAEILGPYAQIPAPGAWAVDEGYWTYLLLRSRASGIRGGTSEILRNVLAERVLGLPRD
jgi:alkylation response protein AidB-like acyl-CoA dehydrogenase